MYPCRSCCNGRVHAERCHYAPFPGGAGDRTAMTSHPLCLAGTLVGSMDGDWLAPAGEMGAVASGSWPLSPEPNPIGWRCFPRIAHRTPGVDARSVRAPRDIHLATSPRCH